jgi:hypothetical protein
LEIEKIRIRNDLKRKAVGTKESKNNIIISEIKKLTVIEQASLIRIESLKKIVTRERMKNLGSDIKKFHGILIHCAVITKKMNFFCMILVMMIKTDS